MDKKHQVHNLIILDESGSMESIKKLIITGFNELIQSIKSTEAEITEQEHFISFVSFNSQGNKLLHFIDPVSSLKELNDKSYRPDAMTPLYDAIGYAVNKLDSALEGKSDYNVLVTIMTDGMENASREYSAESIQRLIEGKKEKNWTFTYIGTDHDVAMAAGQLNIDNVLAFEKNDEGITEMFKKEIVARRQYSFSIRDNKSFTRDFFEGE